MKLKHNIKQYQKKLKRFGKEIDKGTMSALNKTNTTMFTRTKRELSKISGLKQKEVGQFMNKQKATMMRFVSSIFVRGKSLNIHRFGARQMKSGVKAKPWNKPHLFKGAFIMNNRTVMIRTSKNRFPIRGVHGPSLKKEFTKNVLTSDFKKASHNRFMTLFYKEMKYRRGRVFGTA
jgi:hypothetical protein